MNIEFPTPKYKVGDKVWYMEERTVEPIICQSCGTHLELDKVNRVPVSVVVTEIEIRHSWGAENKTIESSVTYCLLHNDGFTFYVFESGLYPSEEEALKNVS